MQDLIKRYFWVLGALVALTCAVFAAKAVDHGVEALVLGDPDHGPKIAPVIAAAPIVTTKPVRSKDGAAFATRDMFCSDCKPPEPTSIKTDTPGGPSIVITTLPLQLLATNVSARAADSFASIVNTEHQNQGSYGIGDKIPGATGVLKEIHYQYVDFENAGHIERLGLMGAPPPVIAAAPPPPSEPTAGSDDDQQAAIDAAIKKIDDTHFEIDRAFVDKVTANPMAWVGKGARLVPAVKNGKPDGFKLYAIRPTSVYGRLGLVNGDTLDAVNGMELTSVDAALAVYAKLKDGTSFQLDVTRRGKATTLNYTIR